MIFGSFLTYLCYYLIIIFFELYVRFVQYSNMFECLNCQKILPKYDYIVVGAGVAGSVVARRLAQSGDNLVLLLEAGGQPNGFFYSAGLGPFFQKTEFDWQYRTVPQRNACKALLNHKSRWPMGKVFGGSNMLNNLIYTRGHPDDYKKWYAESPKQFDYKKDILYYFEKAENILLSKENYGNFNGSTFINSSPYITKFGEELLSAFKEMEKTVIGFKYGFFAPKVTVENNERWTTARHLTELKYPNLHIRKLAYVEEILFDNNTVARGVKFKMYDETYNVLARKGVILSAGVIGSPKILMLSGIGPQKHLDEHKIKTKVNLSEVGQNLQDHVTTGLDFLTVNPDVTLTLDKTVNLWSFYDLIRHKKGPLTSCGCEVIGFVNTEHKKCIQTKQLNCDRLLNGQPDLQFMALPVGITVDKGLHLLNLIGLNSTYWDQYYSSFETGTGVTILPIVLHPKSRGNVKLASKNPHDAPVINPKYLSHPYDIEIILEGIKIIKTVIKTAVMKNIGAKIPDKKYPGCENFTFDSDPYWRCYIEQLTLTAYHPIGTCKMGSSPNNSVVNFNFEVHNTKNLYVVDASVFPSHVSGNPMASVIMIAEKASDFILSKDSIRGCGGCVMSSRKTSFLEIVRPEKQCNVTNNNYI